MNNIHLTSYSWLEYKHTIVNKDWIILINPNWSWVLRLSWLRVKITPLGNEVKITPLGNEVNYPSW